MADVARLAGVSPTTVSFVVNERLDTGISEETRDRVRAAVAQLDYRPNRAAAALRHSRTHAIGLHVTPTMLDRSTFALSLLAPLIRAADAHGYQLMTFTDHGDEVERLAELVRTHAVDGFVLTDSRVDDPRARFLATRDIPFAMMGRLALDLPACWVDVDNGAAIMLALDHLESRGHTDIGFVMPDRSSYWWEDRLDAFHQWHESRGREVSPGLVLRGAPSEVRTAVAALLRSSGRPTALVSAGDEVVVSCYRGAADAGLRVGADVALIGFDQELWMLDPPLTTLRLPLDAIATTLLDRLVDRMDSGPSPTEGLLLCADLDVRGSA
jgi:DNA-binding LacI/PurR family transcriptional regulator